MIKLIFYLSISFIIILICAIIYNFRDYEIEENCLFYKIFGYFLGAIIGLFIPKRKNAKCKNTASFCGTVLDIIIVFCISFNLCSFNVQALNRIFNKSKKVYIDTTELKTFNFSSLMSEIKQDYQISDNSELVEMHVYTDNNMNIETIDMEVYDYYSSNKKEYYIELRQLKNKKLIKIKLETEEDSNIGYKKRKKQSLNMKECGTYIDEMMKLLPVQKDERQICIYGEIVDNICNELNTSDNKMKTSYYYADTSKKEIKVLDKDNRYDGKHFKISVNCYEDNNKYNNTYFIQCS